MPDAIDAQPPAAGPPGPWKDGMSSKFSVGTAPAPGEIRSWHDSARPTAERAGALVPLMTLDAKIAQLIGVRAGADATAVAAGPTTAASAPASPGRRRSDTVPPGPPGPSAPPRSRR